VEGPRPAVRSACLPRAKSQAIAAEARPASAAVQRGDAATNATTATTARVQVIVLAVLAMAEYSMGRDGGAAGR